MYKKLFLFATFILPQLSMADNASELHISQLNVNKGEGQLTLNMTIDPKEFKIKGDQLICLTPKLIGEGSDTLAFRSGRIAGKGAWVAEIREGKANGLTLARAGKGDPIEYSNTIPFDESFIHSKVIIISDTTNICKCNAVKKGIIPIANLDFRPFSPNLSYRYVVPADSIEKIFNISGRANIVFKVNRTEIDWSFANNYAELDTILKTINIVRDNKDASVESITLRGYASPEGSYANNVRLAKGRTEAVKDYVIKNSTFPTSIYSTFYVPEDWEGLREWLLNSNLPQKTEMIAFIDDESIPIETKNEIFRKRFPEEYPFLLKNVYPSLRHTDYQIIYKVRRYFDVAEIREVMHTNPRNLSLNELFLLANSCEPGSEEYNEAFYLAARLYPDSEIANLNAANSAMNSGHYAEAARFLERAGASGMADYAHGVLALLTGNIEEAEEWFVRAKESGVVEAQSGLDEIARYRNFKGEVELL